MDSRKALRESTEALAEYIGGASYPGPEPGKLWSVDLAYPGHPASRLVRDLESRKKADAEAEQKKKQKPDIRPELRKLSLWLQQKAKR